MRLKGVAGGALWGAALGAGTFSSLVGTTWEPFFLARGGWGAGWRRPARRAGCRRRGFRRQWPRRSGRRRAGGTTSVWTTFAWGTPLAMGEARLARRINGADDTGETGRESGIGPNFAAN